MKRALVIFGTRPEVIKLAPVVRAAEEKEAFDVVTCATAQHRGLLDQVLEYFSLFPDFDLDLMTEGQTLTDLTARCLTAIRGVIEKVEPSLIVVQGDTATAFTGALAAFYSGVSVAHVEAGLRTGNGRSPFPEEYFRRAIADLADYHFAPTPIAAANLKKENVSPDQIFVTGNTVVDALEMSARKQDPHYALEPYFDRKKTVLLTTHRRENFGDKLLQTLHAVRVFALCNPDTRILYPVHPNPNVMPLAQTKLGGLANVSLMDPLSYGEMIYVLRRVQFVVTDSGGLQEEAPTFGKPVLVLRDTTERPEAVIAGCSLLVGHNPKRLFELMTTLADASSPLFRSMSHVANPYGDGQAGRRIVDILARAQVLSNQDPVMPSARTTLAHDPLPKYNQPLKLPTRERR